MSICEGGALRVGLALDFKKFYKTQGLLANL